MKKHLKWIIPIVGVVSLWLIIVAGIAIKHHTDRLYWEDPAHADQVTDRWIVTVVIIIGGILAIGVICGIVYLLHLREQSNLRFEASIAELSPEEQVIARRRRAAVEAAVMVGSSIAAHELLKHREHVMAEERTATRERNAAIVHQSHHYYED